MATASNPLTPYSDQVTNSPTDALTPGTSVGVRSPTAPDDPASIRPLSEQAYRQMHPEQFAEPEDPFAGGATTTTTTSGGGGGPLPTPEIPEFDESDFGTFGGGQYVSDNADAAQKIVSFAQSMLGRPYIWGGTSRAGVDCSGLVQLAYAAAGVKMPRLSYDQMWKGKPVKFTDLKPGDLVGWNNSTRFPGADHIAIYIGNDQIIEAPRPGAYVRISGLYDYNVAEMWGVRIPGTQKPKPKATVPATKRAIEEADTRRATAKKKPPTPAEAHSTGFLAVR